MTFRYEPPGLGTFKLWNPEERPNIYRIQFANLNGDPLQKKISEAEKPHDRRSQIVIELEALKFAFP
jgi:hypothetical protein